MHLITGGAGFIGSNLAAHLLADAGCSGVVVYDRLTYAGNLDNLASVSADPRYRFVAGDVCDRARLRETMARYRPEVVFHLAAESHVDRSIDDGAEFIRTNVVGTFEMLEAARAHWQGLGAAGDRFRFVHVSTDEVFGSLGASEFASENSRHAPNSPYAASKSASDQLVRAWVSTYGLPAIVTNCTNNYGPRQFPEKLIPLVTLNALDDKPLPVYGDGRNVRDWLHVEDHCRALVRAAERGLPGDTYCIGAGNELTTLEVVHAVCAALDAIVPPKGRASYRELVSHVADRPGHDRRYALDASKLRQLGWEPRIGFEEGIRRTIAWYLQNRAWCERITTGVYRRERLGLGGPSGASA
jgi:dTDP-glucose 4,6-dehydratase